MRYVYDALDLLNTSYNNITISFQIYYVPI